MHRYFPSKPQAAPSFQAEVSKAMKELEQREVFTGITELEQLIAENDERVDEVAYIRHIYLEGGPNGGNDSQRVSSNSQHSKTSIDKFRKTRRLFLFTNNRQLK